MLFFDKLTCCPVRRRSTGSARAVPRRLEPSSSILLRQQGSVQSSPRLALHDPDRSFGDSRVRTLSRELDRDDCRVDVPKGLDVNFLETSLPHPVLAFGAGVLESASRFDQHVKARKKP